MPVQQQKPIKIGFPPVFINFTISVFKPIADIASTIKNLLSILIGENTPELTPSESASVVITDAPTKYSINIGKICINETLF